MHQHVFAREFANLDKVSICHSFKVTYCPTCYPPLGFLNLFDLALTVGVPDGFSIF